MFYFSRIKLSFSSTFLGKITIFKAKFKIKHFLSTPLKFKHFSRPVTTLQSLQRLHCWSMGMDKQCRPTLYNGRNYLSMLGSGLTTAPLFPFRKSARTSSEPMLSSVFCRMKTFRHRATSAAWRSKRSRFACFLANFSNCRENKPHEDRDTSKNGIMQSNDL